MTFNSLAMTSRAGVERSTRAAWNIPRRARRAQPERTPWRPVQGAAWQAMRSAEEGSRLADIKDFANFQARLDESIKGMDGLLRRHPKDPMLVSIRRLYLESPPLTRGGERRVPTMAVYV